MLTSELQGFQPPELENRTEVFSLDIDTCIGATTTSTQRLHWGLRYHDFETDFYQNWNRYYDPSIGRYLQPEPLLQDPRFIADRAKEGMSTPAYAYANNNPIAYVDPTGLYTIDLVCKNEAGKDVPLKIPGPGKEPKCHECEVAREIAQDRCDRNPGGADCRCANKIATETCRRAGGSCAPPGKPPPPSCKAN